MVDYADVHSLDLQRSYEMLCLLAGSSKQNYQLVAQLDLVPPNRLPSCPSEYKEKAKSYDQVLDEHIEGDFTLAG